MRCAMAMSNVQCESDASGAGRCDAGGSENNDTRNDVVAYMYAPCPTRVELGGCREKRAESGEGKGGGRKESKPSQ